MKTSIVLLRGINVGGRNVLPMKDLIRLLEGLGCRDVTTYIQSGNAALRCPEETAARLAGELSAAIQSDRGFKPHVLVLTLESFERAILENPYPQAAPEPKTLHLGFLDSAPLAPDLESMENLKAESERFHLDGRVFYLHAPDGIGRSKLAERAERALGVPMTMRNWRTVCAIRDMAKALG